MYYHALVSVEDKNIIETDYENLNEIIDDLIIPYLKSERVHFKGYFIDSKGIQRIVIKESEVTTKERAKYENDHMSEGLIWYVSNTDIVEDDSYGLNVITKKVFNMAQEKMKILNNDENRSTDKMNVDMNKVFIVHGRDNLAKTEVARFIEKLGLTPIILHEQASANMTIIEKIESYSNVGYGLVLYTPCDIGALNDGNNEFKPRARQNVVFEHGYLIGKLGRERVSALVKGVVEIPNDISGIVYTNMDDAHAWEYAIAKELRHLGYDIDMNKL